MAETKMTMRVIVNEGDIRKLTVNPRPNTVDDLINWIKTTIQANYEFNLQYDEPEFDNAPVNLRDVRSSREANNSYHPNHNAYTSASIGQL